LRSHPELARGITCCVHCGIRFLTHPCNANRRDLRCPFGCRKHHRRQCGNQRSATYSQTPQGRERKKLHNQRRSRRIANCGGDQPLDARPRHDRFSRDGDLTVEVSSHPKHPSPGESRGGSFGGPAAEAAHLELPLKETFGDQSRASERQAVAATDIRVASSDAASQDVPARRGHRAAPSRHLAGRVEGLEEPAPTLALEGVSLDEASLVQSPMLEYVQMVASLIEGRCVGRDELVEGLRRTMRQRSLAQRSRTDYILHFLHQHPP